MPLILHTISLLIMCSIAPYHYNIIFYICKATPNVRPEVIYQMGYEGDTALFTFQATGTLIPNISWYFNGAPVDMTNTMKYMISELSFNPTTKNSTLTVLNLESSNMGTYTCNAVNLLSSKSGSGVLTVYGKYGI